MNTESSPVLDDELAALGNERFETLVATLEAAQQELLRAEQDAFVQVLAFSDFVFDAWQRYPDDLPELLGTGDLGETRSVKDYARLCEACVGDDMDSALRHLRRREMVRLVFRDLTRRANLEQTVTELSAFADSCILAALQHHLQRHGERRGVPVDEAGKPLAMAVLAMGKLGGYELNLSSDIDLVFFYGSADDDGVTAYPDAQPFFLSVARDLIASLSNVTAEGFVFRVDMRLRPYGESGNLVPSRRAMEKYYLDQGRDWERYACIKARALAGDGGVGDDFLEWLRPFVYRRYLDYGAFESIRSMKSMIEAQTVKRELHDDVKLGKGGIREAEFVVQTIQLLFGARDARLQTQPLRDVLAALEDRGDLDAETVTTLRGSYGFLRDTEHRIQAIADQQTQKLPADPLSRQRVAGAMGFADVQAFMQRLGEVRAAVSEIFADTLHADTEAEEEEGVETTGVWDRCWLEVTGPNALDHLAAAGFRDAQAICSALLEFRQVFDDTELDPVVTARFDRLIPRLLAAIQSTRQPAMLLARILPVVQAVLRRSTYAAFLLESPRSLETLVNVARLSPWVTDQLAREPSLLYRLDGSLVGHRLMPDAARLTQELATELEALDTHDMEQKMDVLRDFKHGREFDAALLELSGDVSVAQVSDYLSTIAEVVLGAVMDIAFADLVERHGTAESVDGKPCQPGIAVVAYGKFGGGEMGFGSDLDLVFLHGGSLQGSTNGPRSIPNEAFFNRLAQRVVNMLTTRTAMGTLYEVDLRLRPHGASGPPTCSVSAFERYQMESAWTWEHQALVRARAVAGDPKIMQAFDRIRMQALGLPRDRSALREEVVAMREKMRTHLSAEPIQASNKIAEKAAEKAAERAAEKAAEEKAAGKAAEKAAGGAAQPVTGQAVEKAAEQTAEKAAEQATGDGHAELLVGRALFDLKHGLGAIIDIEFMVQYLVLVWSNEYPELARSTSNVRLLAYLAADGLIEATDHELLQEAYLDYRNAAHFEALGGRIFSGAYAHLDGLRERVVAVWQRQMEAPLEDHE